MQRVIKREVQSQSWGGEGVGWVAGGQGLG